MRQFRLKISFLFISAVLVFGSCETSSSNESRVSNLPYYQEASFTPLWLSTDSDSLPSLHKISAFSLLNQLGDTITNQSLSGKLYVANFFFTTCPGICPKMTDNMKILQDYFLLDENIILLSHSVTPEWDSVSVLKEYAEKKGVDNSKWFLLTGDRSVIYSLGRNDYFIEEDMGLERSEDDFLHTENLVLVDKAGHLRGIYNGLNATAIQQLISDVRTLKKESDQFN